jgi:D-beta-D-heptose 7-phosphate kinase/D-beta-D-heptose 1-phosphate adenosyltransferase
MSNLVLPWLDGNKLVKIAVVGDIILDEYLDGTVSRISPEAPVPVHRVTQSTQTAGGGANAARNIRHAGGEALLFSVTGQDEGATQLFDILTTDGISTAGILQDPGRPTVKKTRITASHQQLLRIDWERVHPIHESFQEALFQKLNAETFSALLISDYGKGTLPESFVRRLISMAHARGIPCIVDPKCKDFSRYAGADLITPNTKEAVEALDLDAEDHHLTGEDLGRRLQAKYALRNILVTMGSRGMVFCPTSPLETPLSVKPQAREVFDVSGAGDTVVAIMALAMGAGCGNQKSMELANIAAGIVVGKWGTQPVYKNELEAALWHSQTRGITAGATRGKIVTKEELRPLFRRPVFQEKKVVFTNGCFDILHAGHVTYLEEAKTKGDILVVAINSDSSITRFKGPSRPIIPLEQRMIMLASLSCVDFVVSFDEDTPKQVIEYLKPHVLVKGADYKIDDIVGREIVEENGGMVTTIRLVPGISTSEIIRRTRLDT